MGLIAGRVLHARPQVAPLAAAFVGYVVFWNLSLQMNSVGFYQLSKIMVLPTVAALEVRAPLAASGLGLTCMHAARLHGWGARVRGWHACAGARRWR